MLDIHDGELMPTLENRRTITRKIREWQADVVISPRPNDYHPDHRYTAILVQDAAFMVIVPSFCPDVPALRKNPVFLYCQDGFKKPNPFTPDVVVPIDPVIEQKVACIDALESQFYEWNPWLFGYSARCPAGRRARAWTGRGSGPRSAAQSVADRFRAKLVELLGEDGARPSSMPRPSRSASTAASPRRRADARSFRSSAGVIRRRDAHEADRGGWAPDGRLADSVMLDRRCRRPLPRSVNRADSACRRSPVFTSDSHRSEPAVVSGTLSVRRSAGGDPCRGRRPRPCGPRG